MNNLTIGPVDNKIIELLQKNARMSYSDIGKEVGISRTAVKNRMEALERVGVITGYTVLLDSQEYADELTFIVNVETKPDNFKEVCRAMEKSPLVKTLVQTSGNCHLMAVCSAEDVKTIREFIHEMYNSQPGVLSINHHAVMDIVKGKLSHL